MSQLRELFDFSAAAILVLDDTDLRWHTLRREGFDARKVGLYPDRPNVVAILPGSSHGRSLCFNSHMDTGRRGDNPWILKDRDVDFYHHAWVQDPIIVGDGVINDVFAARIGPAGSGPYPTVVEYSGYDPANPVLRDISVKIEPGQRMARLTLSASPLPSMMRALMRSISGSRCGPRTGGRKASREHGQAAGKRRRDCSAAAAALLEAQATEDLGEGCAVAQPLARGHREVEQPVILIMLRHQLKHDRRGENRERQSPDPFYRKHALEIHPARRAGWCW